MDTFFNYEMDAANGDVNNADANKLPKQGEKLKSRKTVVRSVHCATRYFSMMSADVSGVDSERAANVSILRERKNVLRTSSSSDSDNDRNYNGKQLNSPLATSSPLNRNNENMHDYNGMSKRFVETSDATENREKERSRSISNINEPFSRKSFRNFTNISNAKQLPIASCSTKNTSNIEATDDTVALNSSSGATLNSKLNGTTSVNRQLRALVDIGNDLTSRVQYDETCTNRTDLSNIFRMELTLKMFSENVAPYLNSLKHDLLQLMNNCVRDGRMIGRWKNAVRRIRDIIKLNVDGRDAKLNKEICATIPFVAVDLNALHALNAKLKHVGTILEPIKLSLNDELLKGPNEGSTKQLDARQHGDCDRPDRLKLLEPVIDRDDSVISLNTTEPRDSFDPIREFDKSNGPLSPIHKSIVFRKSSPELSSLRNYSLKCTDAGPNKDAPETFMTDINSPTEELPDVDLTVDNGDDTSALEVEARDDDRAKTKPNRYWLRKRPKSTEHYFAPLNSISVKRKTGGRSKTKYNDIFVTEGSGKKKCILQYKLHSLLPNNSGELINKLCPETVDNNNQNATVFGVPPNLEPRTNCKPCRCGIFPSQVPSHWNDSLHKCLHRNLHKLRFDVRTTTVDVVSKINDNGLLYDVIKITKNSDTDRTLELTLKNVQDFINLELDTPNKKNINNTNHSVFLAVIPNLQIIGYLEIDSLGNACVYQDNRLSDSLIGVKFGVSKLWVMVKYRNSGVATKLLTQFRDQERLEANDIAFAYHGNHGISFIKKYFGNNSVLIY